jgi:hemerythrin superfamily protein
MKELFAFDDAVDLLDADHKAVKKMFIDYSALCEEGAPASDKGSLAQRICQELAVHTQIEEELFYPQVRAAIGEEALMDEAVKEHAEAKETIARIQGMDAADDAYDDTVKHLGRMIDQHVLQEREQIFLQARQSALDLRAMADALLARKKELKNAARVPVEEAS